MSQRMYADQAEFIHTLFTVKGKQNIFGAQNFWDVLNRRTKAKVKRLGELSNQTCPMLNSCCDRSEHSSRRTVRATCWATELLCKQKI